ncbi:MAG TPA: hypothetical protein G4O12_04240 [Dehalococcoidia bacterium]|nr:hypothetical protein [Dehalococcoidia bacterium]
MVDKPGGWQYLLDYQGQHPDYAELNDPPHPVKVMIYGRGNKRKAISKTTGEVEFEYEVYPENIGWWKRNCGGFGGTPTRTKNSGGQRCCQKC